ncbi:hypothetical protein [Maridesulfovibrio sp. FT414]|uniref:hypothetical protein n=1 Tax=Maridesulfovibrio sp. FT414 TaxID=2979469 RepID=UPI003D80A145
MTIWADPDSFRVPERNAGPTEPVRNMGGFPEAARHVCRLERNTVVSLRLIGQADLISTSCAG